jgi:hypothetical protein
MDDEVDPRAEPLDRRLRIGHRLVLYPLALGLIVFAWQYLRSDPPQAEATSIVSWSGVTSQRKAIAATTGDGRLTSINTYLVERCSNGSSYTQQWYPGRYRFVQDGENARARQKAASRSRSGVPVVFDAQVRAHMGAHPSGTIRAQVSWTTGHGTLRCDSGPVTFALRRSR